jgi:hypothetical protein
MSYRFEHVRIDRMAPGPGTKASRTTEMPLPPDKVLLFHLAGLGLIATFILGLAATIASVLQLALEMP